jgi:CDP-diacylglycerol--glycerol-3-phosphate 3-phosphatidyltransferase
MFKNTPPETDRQIRTAVPLAITSIRVILAPLLLVWAWNGRAGIPFVICLFVGAGTDFLDGILARRLGVATPTVRRLDGAADVIFYLAAFVSVWLVYPDVVRAHWPGLSLVAGMELLRVTVDYVKFRREASYHMYSAKLWNLTLFAALAGLMGFGISGWLFQLPIVVGILTNLEALAASLLLPTWTHDVPTVYHAYRLRQEGSNQ